MRVAFHDAIGIVGIKSTDISKPADSKNKIGPQMNQYEAGLWNQTLYENSRSFLKRPFDIRARKKMKSQFPANPLNAKVLFLHRKTVAINKTEETWEQSLIEGPKHWEQTS